MEKIEDIEDYLRYVGRFRKSRYGKQFRSQFRDSRGTAELAMLAAPSEEEYEEFERVVAEMSDEEKRCPEALSDEQIGELARRSGADRGNVSIFLNGYVLARRQAQSG